MPLQIERPKATPAARVSTQARAAGQAGRTPGTGATATVMVKGVKADSAQLKVINGALGEAHQLGGSRRLLIAVMMCMTQESACRSLSSGDAAGPDSRGPFQQRAPWGTVTERESPASSCQLFLLGGHSAGTFGWKHYFGSLLNVPGDIGAGIQKVQHSGFPGAYSQWQPEATKTVDAWLGNKVQGEDTAFSVTSSRTVIEPYEFTRGQQGQRENSWDCMGRLADEVTWSRWAELNTLCFASDDELRAAAPSLQLTGDEDWLRSPPAWEWSPKRAVNKITLEVWADRWGCQIGACVDVSMGLAIDGRYLVTETHGTMVSPELQVVLERPAPKRLEPAPTTRTVTSTSSSAAIGGQFTNGGLSGALKARTPEAIVAVAQFLSNFVKQNGVKYPNPVTSGDRNATTAPSVTHGMDCSASVGWVLYNAGFTNLPGSPTAAPVSGAYEDWGEPGPGRQVTIWTDPSHIFLEFHLAGQPHMQGNTSYSGANGLPHGSGFQYFPWGGNGAFDARRFIARHPPGC